MVAKHRKAMRDPEAGVRKLARLFGEEVARPMAESLAIMSEESIRAIVRDCSRVACHASPPTFSAAARSRMGRKTRTYDWRGARFRASIPTRSSSCGRGGATVSA